MLSTAVCVAVSVRSRSSIHSPRNVSRFRSSLPCVAWKAAGIIHINRPYESCRNSVFFLHFWASARILDISCALTIWHWGYSRLHPPSDEIRGAWPSAFIRVTATSSLALQSCKTKIRAYVGLEEQILLNNLTERRISSVSFFFTLSFASNTSRQWCDWSGQRAKKFSRGCSMKTFLMFTPNFCSLSCSHVVFYSRHSLITVKRNWGDWDNERRAAIPGMQHPLPGEGSPETQQRQQKQRKTTLSCYSLSASCLLCSVISSNSPYSVYSPHQERRNQSGNVSLTAGQGGGGWGVCLLAPN